MSLDGFIAGPRDDMTWLADYHGPNPTADEVLAQVGALLIGDRTYQLAKTEEGKQYGGAWTGPQLVLSHHHPPRTPQPASPRSNVSDRLKSPADTHASRGSSFICTMLDHPRRLALRERCERLLRQHSPHGQREALQRVYSAALRAAE